LRGVKDLANTSGSPGATRRFRPALPTMRGEDSVELCPFRRLPHVLLGAMRHHVAFQRGVADVLETRPPGDERATPKRPVASEARVGRVGRHGRAATPGFPARCNLWRARTTLVLASLCAWCSSPRLDSRRLRDLRGAGAGTHGDDLHSRCSGAFRTRGICFISSGRSWIVVWRFTRYHLTPTGAPPGYARTGTSGAGGRTAPDGFPSGLPNKPRRYHSGRYVHSRDRLDVRWRE
jgi:hypothetical protein